MESLASSPPLVSTSLAGRPWVLREVNDAAAAAAARELEVPLVLARMLLGRGIAAEEAWDFLNPSLRHSLPDPSQLKDMDAAAERVASAVIAAETIAIFGDYDVDGATSSALLFRLLRALGAAPLVYIPDRLTEGYGPNAPALLHLKERGASLIITVDCGTLAFEPLAAAHEAGLDVIVVDHHLSEARLPPALAVVNPNRLDETFPHRQLAAVGVAFLLAVAVVRQLRRAGFFATRAEPDTRMLLDLVALGTICDVVPLSGPNRALVAQGLKVMAMRQNVGLRTLMDVARVDERPGTYTCGFILGPRVNAGGRVGHAAYGAQLLATEDAAEALTLARALDHYNEERKAIEAMVLEQAQVQAAEQEHAPVVLVAGQRWHPGVVGIVAGRLKEALNKPVAVVGVDGGVGKASARSVAGFDFGAAVISAVETGLLLKGGGHMMAAGFTVEEAKLPALHEFFIRRYQATSAARVGGHALKLDACIALSGLTSEMAEALERAGPFGQGHASPRVMVADATVLQADVVGGAHIRLLVADDSGARCTAMSFRSASTAFGRALLGLRGKRVHLAGQIRLRVWQGVPQASFTVEDAAWA